MPAYLSADFADDIAKSVVRGDQMLQRVKNWANTYDQPMAQNLINAAANYPWVPPELTASIVLSGNDHLMEHVARHCAERMGQTGLAWGDRAKMQRFYERESAARAVPWKD